MKKIIAIAVLLSVAFVGCKEKPPIINLTPSTPKFDTSYTVSPVPSADPHNVLIEDFTGASCTNCPAAHDQIVSLAGNNPGRINGIALHVTDYPQATPTNESKFDFRTKVATDIESYIYQTLKGMPTGGIDRQPYGANTSVPLQCDANIWVAKATSRLTVVDSINVAVVSSYDSVAKTAKITALVTYLYPTSTVHALSLAIVEDSIVDAQEDNRVQNYLDSFYHFNDVLRDLVTSSPYGDKVAPTYTSKAAGLVYQRTYTYSWNAAWKPRNCRVIAFVTGSDATGGVNVYQSVQCKVMP